MSNEYKLRVYESCAGDGAISSGTVVQLVDPTFTLSADSAQQAAEWISTNVLLSRFLGNRISQICPMMSNAEPTRSVAISLNGSSIRVSLNSASGQCGELRRVRGLKSSSVAVEERSTQRAA